jgi:hypothetical protein
MGKRYVFFRNDHGKAHRDDDPQKVAPIELLSIIGKSASIANGNSIAWSTFDIRKWETALRSTYIVFDPDGNELAGEDGWRIFHGALINLIKANPGVPIKADSLLDKADDCASEFFREVKETSFYLVTSLAVEALPSKLLRVKNCVISPLGPDRKQYPFPEQLVRQVTDSHLGLHLTSSKYLWIKVKVNARTTIGAVEAALEAVNLLRAVWSFLLSYRDWSFSVGGSPSPKSIGTIHLGPLHTLHHLDGTNAEPDLYWYQPEYAEEKELVPKGHLVRIQKRHRSVFRKMKNSPLRAAMGEVFVRYVTALDNHNLNVTFLELWSLLERLTNTIGGPYDQTIKRIASTYEDRALAKEMLQSLRLARNLYVHSARTPHQTDQVVYMVKYFLDPMLRQLILNHPKAVTLEEFGDFWALPPDENELIKQITTRKRSLALRQKAKEVQKKQEADQRRVGPVTD